MVAVDGSDESMKAVKYALQLAAVSKGKVLLLHVLLFPPGTDPETLDAVRKDLSAKGKDLLRKAGDLNKASGFQPETRMVETDRSVSMTIVDFCAKEKADLIVLGTKGTSGYGRLMLGSTAAGTVSFANCPVLAVR